MSDSSHQSVSLGCGTLILIAIIVAVFGSRGSDKELDQRLKKIEKKMESIEEGIQRIEAGQKAG
jgi:hypothetical protein